MYKCSGVIVFSFTSKIIKSYISTNSKLEVENIITTPDFWILFLLLIAVLFHTFGFSRILYF